MPSYWAPSQIGPFDYSPDSDQQQQIQAQEIQRKTRPEWTEDPALWIKEKLGEHLWSKQIEIARAVHDYRRVAVPSAHETGKSFVAARLAAWWLDIHNPGDAFVVTTAPSGPQVRAVLWREINRAHAKGNLPGRTNQTEWWMNGELVAFGRKPSDYDPSAFQGIHARYVLVILDEACGIPESLYMAANSLAANEHSRILAIGNPDDYASHFAKICAVGTTWHVIHVDGLQSPNFTNEPIPEDLRDMLISQAYVDEMAGDVGEDSPIYKSKVRGQFSDDVAGGVVPLSAVRKCQGDFEHAPDDLLPVEIGFDVGAGGDDAVLREKRGIAAGRTERYRTTDPMALVGHALNFINETGATSIKVDVIGIGWGIAGRLEELGREGKHKAVVHRVNVGLPSSSPKRFPRLRDEIWWECGREVIMTGAVDLTAMDDKTIAQLTSPTWKPDSAGRIHVEPKIETKARIGRSPDDADAWLLAVYQPTSRDMWFV